MGKNDPAELRSSRVQSRFQIANNLKPKQNYEEKSEKDSSTSLYDALPDAGI